MCPGLGAIAPKPGAKCPREAVPRENGSGEGRVESASDDDVAGGGDKSNGLDQPHRPEAAVIGPADDDMVVQRNPQLRRRFRNILGDRDILPARFGAAAWMVVDEDERRGAEFERSEEHTSELQSLMRISYAVFCLKKKKNTQKQKQAIIIC